MRKKRSGISDKKYNKKQKLKLVKAICEEECNLLYMNKDIDVSFDHYSDEVHTVFLRENPKTTNRVTHADVRHIQERIHNEVTNRWYLGLLVTRPELFYGYSGDDDEDEDDGLNKEPLY